MQKILIDNNLSIDLDGIYMTRDFESSSEQNLERNIRESIAVLNHKNYLNKISMSHSIPVMDKEVQRFLKNLPINALIIDVGGCWGWHWRNLDVLRPDVEVLIIDFVKSNLSHAKVILKHLLGKQVYLMHADATFLPFGKVESNNFKFDAIWSVQVFQHIPNYEKACYEAFRVLKIGGKFVTYSLHITPFVLFVYRLIGKKYFLKGIFNDQFYLERANDNQRNIILQIFGNVKDRYTECLFHPDLKIRFTGKENNIFGIIDSYLGNFSSIGKYIARQRSFSAIKR